MSASVDSTSRAQTDTTMRVAVDSAPATETADISDIGEGKVFAPAAYPGAAIVGSIIGLLLVGLAAVGIRDHIVRFGWITGNPWLGDAATWIAHSTWQGWMWPAAIGLVVVGLAMLWLAIKPRRKSHVSLGDHRVMWTRRGDVARRVSASLLAVAGVEHATTVVGRRTARVTVTTTGDVDTAALIAQGRSAVASLKRPPRIKIRKVVRTTVPQETVAQETVPQETVAQETVAQEQEKTP
ncbi:hypothetical protein ABLE92_23430 [Gordonia sp. VNQ95]|uniref:hypothetical protein n=1 Tax=Gordonia TaxID=2053 RepID=UPI0032B57A08